MNTETTPALILELRDAVRREPVGTPARERAVLALADALDAQPAPVTPVSLTTPPLGVSAEVAAYMDRLSIAKICTMKPEAFGALLDSMLNQSAQPNPTARERALEEALRNVMTALSADDIETAKWVGQSALTTPSKPAGGSGQEET